MFVGRESQMAELSIHEPQLKDYEEKNHGVKEGKTTEQK